LQFFLAGDWGWLWPPSGYAPEPTDRKAGIDSFSGLQTALVTSGRALKCGLGRSVLLEPPDAKCLVSSTTS